MLMNQKGMIGVLVKMNVYLDLKLGYFRQAYDLSPAHA